MVFPHLVVRMFTLGYPNSIVGRSLTILQASYRSVAGSVLVCPTFFWMPWLLDTEESNETFLEVWEFFHILDIFKYSNMLVVPQNSFLSFDGKPFQVHPSSSGVSLETTE